jgi:MFS family permease
MSGRPAPSLALLSAITALAFCGLHMVVPALLLAAVFTDTPTHVRLVVSLYLAGIAAGQLVYGPVSDRFGRRPVLLAGLAAFLAGPRRLPRRMDWLAAVFPALGYLADHSRPAGVHLSDVLEAEIKRGLDGAMS